LNDVRNELKKFGTIEPSIVTFTDSAILTVNPDLNIADFYKVVINLRKYLKAKGTDSYCIVNRDEEKTHPLILNSLEYRNGSRRVLAYANAWGSGPVWVNIYCADQVIHLPENKSSAKYDYYCVGDANIIEQSRGETFKFKYDKLEIFGFNINEILSKIN